MANSIGAVDLQQLEGLFKEVYGSGLENLIPESGKLMRMLEFKKLTKLGDVFKIPVVVSTEQGVTYAGPEEDVVDLEDAEAMSTKPASVKGAQIIARAAIGYKTAASAMSNGKEAFANATEAVVKALMDNSVRRVELALLYGGSSLSLTVGSTNIDATTTRLEFDPKTFAAGMWVGSRNTRLEIWDESGSSQIGTEFKVKKVLPKTYELEVTGLAGDITALDAAAASGLDVYFKTSRGKQSLGLDKIISTSGVLFGIDNTEYDLFKGQVEDALNAALSFDKITDAVINATHYGLEGDVICLCSPETWQSLNKDEAALRQYDASFRSAEAEKGVEGITYHYQMGKITVVSHSMVKQGEAYIFKPDQLSRVGAWDVSLRTPGFDDKIFHRLEGKTAFELRTYTDQALFTDRPAHMIKIINIVN